MPVQLFVFGSPWLGLKHRRHQIMRSKRVRNMPSGSCLRVHDRRQSWPFITALGRAAIGVKQRKTRRCNRGQVDEHLDGRHGSVRYGEKKLRDANSLRIKITERKHLREKFTFSKNFIDANYIISQVHRDRIHLINHILTLNKLYYETRLPFIRANCNNYCIVST